MANSPGFSPPLESRADGLAILDECSVAMGDTSMPEPDIVLTAEPDGDGPILLRSVRLNMLNLHLDPCNDAGQAAHR